jgi:hypothetical protein
MMDMKDALNILRTGDEAALRDLDMPWAKTDADLVEIIKALSDREHDYGTCVYAMSIAAEAAFNLMAHKLQVTGFQASCADMDFIGRVRHWKNGFRLINYDDLLYPQYRHSFDELSWESLVRENKDHLQKEARKMLAESPNAHPEVLAHWQRLAA